ncbi:hypothetical protein IK146_03295 [Candidatus Saccharibacteria bacterium]|nr:hypothetical protein [Candidatus Saccharibacteria bacterium]
MLNPIVGKDGSILAKKLSTILENPGCYLSDSRRMAIKTAIDWLTGKEMSVDKAGLVEKFAWVHSFAEAFVSPVGLPELLSETISLLELPSVVPLSKKAFMKVDVSSWSFEDPFIADHRPASPEEVELKRAICNLMLEHRVDDFYCPTIHPSHEGDVGVKQHFNQAYMDDYTTHPGDGILFFHDNCEIFTGVDYGWWEKKAKSFSPGNSRMGSENEYVIFCGFLIRSLIKENWSIHEAWGAVCNNRPVLTNGVCGFKNLDHHPKILAASHSYLGRDYSLGGGEGTPVANIYVPSTSDSLQPTNSGGWIVCERNPTETVA